jgi:hypothetical protein
MRENGAVFSVNSGPLCVFSDVFEKAGATLEVAAREQRERSSMVARRVQFRFRSVLFLVLLAARVGVADPAQAQGVGFQGGVSIDPEQAYVGSHYETPGIGGRTIHFRPGIDGGFGSDLKLASINFDILYKTSLGPDWKMYQGFGPSIHIVRFGKPAENDVTGGINGIFGFAHESGLFFEFRGGGGGGPNLKFGVGFTIR